VPRVPPLPAAKELSALSFQSPALSTAKEAIPMRSRLFFIPLALVALIVASSVSAEPVGKYWTVTPFGGFTIFDADMKFPTTHALKDDIYFGGRLGYHFSRWVGLEAAGGFVPTEEDVIKNAVKVDWLHVNGDLMWTPWAGRYGGPFLLTGGGWGRLKPTSGSINTDQGSADYGAGLNFWLSDHVGLRFEARQILWIPKETSQDKFNTTVIGGGITFAMGGVPRDTDGDGVNDRKDKCPNTPKGARVDADGCPHDSDGDGVLDGLDSCPQTPKGATVNSFGCPSDADKDGVFDGIDKCPDTPAGATVDATGCPKDSDGDGVLDGLDKCPDTPAGATVDATGCPKDSDGDGVLDGLDKCPDTPAGAKVDKDGCPVELIERETELLDTGMIRLQDVNFETAKADILPESFGSLDVVGQVLSKWPELRIEVGGHTDSRGSVPYNQKLSEARAASVLTYLKGKFPQLKPEQFSSKGYGELKPIAPNTTDLGMAKNRRVEFVVQNRDVLKKETERRRLLKQSETAPPDSTKK
jgi:outer membrane protein OmpA-like peptidoglycan-associated protein